LDDADADRLLAWAITREEAPPEELAVIFARRWGRRGAARLRRLLPLITSGAASEAELLAQAIFRRAGITGWESDFRIDLPDGSFIKVDLYFKAKRLIVEIDGYAFHGDKRAYQKDHDRDNLLARTGRTVLRFTWEDLTEREDYVVDVVRQALR
jgi:very-short-patch-repair endonuclease